MAISFDSYEKAEWEAEAVFISNRQYKGPSNVCDMVHIWEGSRGSFTVDTYVNQGCHGSLSRMPHKTNGYVFTSMAYSAFNKEDANAYWDWMFDLEKSPWRSVLKKYEHKFLFNAAGERIAFGFKQDGKNRIPMQYVGNIFVATRTPLEKAGYMPVYRAALERFKDETKARYACALAKVYSGATVSTVDGHHYPFNMNGAVHWPKFRDSNIPCNEERLFGGSYLTPVNNFWQEPAFATYYTTGFIDNGKSPHVVEHPTAPIVLFRKTTEVTKRPSAFSKTNNTIVSYYCTIENYLNNLAEVFNDKP